MINARQLLEFHVSSSEPRNIAPNGSDHNLSYHERLRIVARIRAPIDVVPAPETGSLLPLWWIAESRLDG